jgi:hypothetical protein
VLAEEIAVFDPAKAMTIAANAGMHEDSVLRQAQKALGDRVFEATDSLERSAIRHAYNFIVRVLEDRHPEAPCHETDPWLAETFADLYKDDNGFRPHGFEWTAAAVRDWVAVRSINNWLAMLQDHAEDLSG